MSDPGCHPLKRFQLELVALGHKHVHCMSMSQCMDWCVRKELLNPSLAKELAGLYEMERYEEVDVAPEQYLFHSKALENALASASLVDDSEFGMPESADPSVWRYRFGMLVDRLPIILLVSFVCSAVWIAVYKPWVFRVWARELDSIGGPRTETPHRQAPVSIGSARVLTLGLRFDQLIDLSHNSDEGRGVSFVDLDADGNLELSIVSRAGTHLYARTEGKSALLKSNISGPYARTVQWADMDWDSDLDALTVGGRAPPRVWKSAGSGSEFHEIPVPIAGPLNAEGSAWLDQDLDGLLDLMITNGGQGISMFGIIDAKLVDVSVASGLGPEGPAAFNGDFILATDLNGDDYPDIVYNAESGIVLAGGPNGFKQVDWGISFDTLGSASKLGLSAVDFDNDGDLDLYVPQPTASLLFENKGGGKFEALEVSRLGKASMAAMSSTWADLDEDGDLDLIVSTEDRTLEAFRNDVEHFSRVTPEWGLENIPETIRTRGLMFADVDQDGDADLGFSSDAGYAGIIVNRSQIPRGRSRLTVSFAKPPAPDTRVQVIDRSGAIQTRALGIPENIGSQSPYQAWFSVTGNENFLVRIKHPGRAAHCHALRIAAGESHRVDGQSLPPANCPES